MYRHYIRVEKTSHSDDIVDAAWENGLGVHALIWVSLNVEPPEVDKTHVVSLISLASMVMTSGRHGVIPCSHPYTLTRKPNGSLGSCSSGPNLSSIASYLMINLLSK